MIKIQALFTLILSFFKAVPDRMPDVPTRIEEFRTRTPAKIRENWQYYNDVSVQSFKNLAQMPSRAYSKMPNMPRISRENLPNMPDVRTPGKYLMKMRSGMPQIDIG